MGRRWPSGSPALPFLGLARPVRVGRTVSPPTAPACLPCPSRQTGASFSRPALLWPWAALQPSSLNGGVTGCFPQRALHPDPAVTHNSQPAWQVPETGGTQPRPELVSTGTDSPCGQTRRKRLSNTEGKLRHSPSIQTKHEGHSHFVTHSPPPPRQGLLHSAWSSHPPHRGHRGVSSRAVMPQGATDSGSLQTQEANSTCALFPCWST